MPSWLLRLRPGKERSLLAAPNRSRRQCCSKTEIQYWTATFGAIPCDVTLYFIAGSDSGMSMPGSRLGSYQIIDQLIVRDAPDNTSRLHREAAAVGVAHGKLRQVIVGASPSEGSMVLQ